MNMKNWLTELLDRRGVALPVLSFPGAPLMRISIRELVQSAALQSDCMAAVAARWPMPASVSLMDLSVEAEAFGAGVRFSDDEVPTVTGRLLDGAEAVDALAVPPVGAGRTGVYIDAIRQAKQRITDRPILAGMIGPFSLAGRLYDMTEIMVDCLIEPDGIHALLEKTTAFLIDYAKAFQAAGADGLLLAEPAAGLLSPDLGAEFSVPYVRRIAEAVRDDDFLFFYHNCGPYTVAQIDSILTVGASVYHFGNAVDLAEMRKHIPDTAVFSGNIAPAEVLRHGTPETVTEAVRALRGKLDGCPNFLLSSGCDIPPLTPPENIDAFFAAATI